MKRLNTYHLKLIATVLMVLDHIGYLWIPSGTWLYPVLRSVGRLSAPLFWYCFAIGFAHTSDQRRYLVRLGVGAGVMMLGNTAISHFTHGGIGFSWRSPNIFLTMLGVGLLILLLEYLKLKPARIRWIMGACGALCLAFLIFRYGEYGRYAMVCILSFYFIKQPYLRYGLAMALCAFFCVWVGNWRQLFMLAAFPIMWLCGNEKPKRGSKYFFYIFYPAHLWGMTLLLPVISALR